MPPSRNASPSNTCSTMINYFPRQLRNIHCPPNKAIHQRTHLYWCLKSDLRQVCHPSPCPLLHNGYKPAVWLSKCTRYRWHLRHGPIRIPPPVHAISRPSFPWSVSRAGTTMRVLLWDKCQPRKHLPEGLIITIFIFQVYHPNPSILGT